jgi:uncharacterized PurR-regulated membrane protein YhhQ (DUF165 family)
VDSLPAIEHRRPVRETPLERLGREFGRFLAGLARLSMLSALLIPLLIFSFLTVDVHVFAFDHLFALQSVKPSQWLTLGFAAMAVAPLLVILIARRFGGEEAARVVTASWAVAALGAFAGVSYLAPTLSDGDMPGVAYVAAFVGAATMSQYTAAAVYDLTRGRDAWWRAPLYASLGAFIAHTALYFPIAYWQSNAPWLHWMVVALTFETIVAASFLLVYRMLRKSLRPRGGYGG